MLVSQGKYGGTTHATVVLPVHLSASSNFSHLLELFVPLIGTFCFSYWYLLELVLAHGDATVFRTRHGVSGDTMVGRVVPPYLC